MRGASSSLVRGARAASGDRFTARCAFARRADQAPAPLRVRMVVRSDRALRFSPGLLICKHSGDRALVLRSSSRPPRPRPSPCTFLGSMRPARIEGSSGFDSTATSSSSGRLHSSFSSPPCEPMTQSTRSLVRYQRLLPGVCLHPLSPKKSAAKNRDPRVAIPSTTIRSSGWRTGGTFGCGSASGIRELNSPTGQKARKRSTATQLRSPASSVRLRPSKNC